MGALKCTTHLLPLLRLLRFIINACNKCVTPTLVIINGNDDPRLFFTHQLPLCSNCRLLDEIRTNSSDTSYSMYCAFMMVLMFEQLNATCMAKMHLSCGHVSVFLCMFWPLVLHFSLLFPFFYIFSLFSFHSRVCFLFELPFSILHFLVSSSCYFFFF